MLVAVKKFEQSVHGLVDKNNDVRCLNTTIIIMSTLLLRVSK